MKIFLQRILLTVMVLTACATMSAKKYDGSLFSFEYPNTLREANIYNSPHMLLKLESSKYFFSISCFDSNPGVDIWDDIFVERFKSMPRDGNFVSVKKVRIKTKNGLVKGIKGCENTTINGLSTKRASYMFIVGDKMWLLCYLGEGKFTKSTNTADIDRLVSGFYIKPTSNALSPTSKLNSQITDLLISKINIINRQLPLQIDDYSVVNNVILIGTTVVFKVKIYDGIEEYVDYNVFKNNMIRNLSVALPEEFLYMLKEENFSIQYHIYNENDNICKILNIPFAEIISAVD